MAERRMFTKKITNSDAFCEMPLSAQALYLHLNMEADDDGFVNAPKRIQKMIGASDDDLKLLLAKKFLIPFESGIVVIKHWRMHNYIQKDRYHETAYLDERNQLTIDSNNAYTVLDTECIQNVSKMDTEVRLGKDRKGKSNRFVPPTVDEVEAYIKEKDYHFDAEEFVAFYESKGWMIGKNKMKSWKSACVTWEKNAKNKPQPYKKEEITPKRYKEFEPEEPRKGIAMPDDIREQIRKIF